MYLYKHILKILFTTLINFWFVRILFHRLGIGKMRVMWGGWEGPYELPPSRGWPCSVQNKLFLKPREAHSSLFNFHYRKCHHCCLIIAAPKLLKLLENIKSAFLLGIFQRGHNNFVWMTIFLQPCCFVLGHLPKPVRVGSFRLRAPAQTRSCRVISFEGGRIKFAKWWPHECLVPSSYTSLSLSLSLPSNTLTISLLLSFFLPPFHLYVTISLSYPSLPLSLLSLSLSFRSFSPLSFSLSPYLP